MAWLPTTGLIRNFTVVVANIAEGPTPAKHVKVLRPAAPFRVRVARWLRMSIRASYDRYTTIADAAWRRSMPAGGRQAVRHAASRGSRTRITISDRADSFDRTLERAIVALLATRWPSTDRSASRPKGIGYGYADDAPRVADARAEAAAAHGPAQRAA